MAGLVVVALALTSAAQAHLVKEIMAELAAVTVQFTVAAAAVAKGVQGVPALVQFAGIGAPQQVPALAALV